LSRQTSSIDNVSDEKIVDLLRTGVWVVSSTAPNVSSVTYVHCMEDKGKIPAKIIKQFFHNSLDIADDLKRYFERNGRVVDAELRDTFASKIPKAVIRDEQQQIINEQLNKVDIDDPHWEHLSKESNG